MKKSLIAMMLLAGASAFAQTRVSIGVGIGSPAYYPPAPPVAYVARPAYPGPGFVWIDGYRGPTGVMVRGYWARRPFADAFWVAPRFTGGRYVAGYWGRPGGDRDRDGIPNRFDRFDNRRGFSNGFDRDRDGVPNRLDRHPNNGFRR